MVLDGKLVSSNIKNKIKESILKNNYTPSLVVLEVGSNASSEVYIRQKEKACNEVGISFRKIQYEDNVLEEKIIKDIEELNNESDVDAILLQLPIPKYLDEEKILNKISYLKDVDGLTLINRNNLENNKLCIKPCTPLGILEIFKYYNIDLKDKNIVIMGRSKLVGMPLYNILKNNNLKVTLTHSKTVDIKSITTTADVLIVAVGKKYLVDKSYVKKGSIIIDVGINKEDNKLYGDVNNEVYNVVSSYTPVPGGVGATTVAMLLSNVLECYKKGKSL